MSTLHKEYAMLENGKEIKFSVNFNKEHSNWATGEKREIGYRVTVIPVKRTTQNGYTMEESGAFTGFGDILLAVERQSKKRLESALKILTEKKEFYLSQFSKGGNYEIK